MLLLTTIGITILAFLNYRYSKSIFHPAVIFCSFWAFDLFVLWAASYLFYRIHPTSLLVFFCGAVTFSAGAFLASLKRTKQPPPTLSHATNRLITIAVWIVVLSVPIYVRWILSLVANRGAAQTFLMAARMSLIEVQGTGIVSTLFGATMLSSIVIAMIAFRERDGHGKRFLIAVCAAMIICVLTATKGAPVWLTIGLLFLHWLKSQRLNLKAVTITSIAFLSIVFSIEFFVHINGNSFQESAVPVLENVALYISGGIVGFDQVIEDPTVIPPIANPPYDTLKRIANRFLGSHLDVAPTIPAYLFIGPHDFRGNTYTIYSSWLIFGVLGSVFLMLPIGYFTARIYYRALAGGACSSILYGLFVSGLAFSPLEDYLSSLSMMAFFAGFSWCVYYMPPRLIEFNWFVSNALRAESQFRRPHKIKVMLPKAKRGSWLHLAYRHWRRTLHASTQDGIRERQWP